MSVGRGTSSFHKHGIQLDTEIPIVLHNLTQSHFCITIQKAWCLGFWIGRDSTKWLPVYSDPTSFRGSVKNLWFKIYTGKGHCWHAEWIAGINWIFPECLPPVYITFTEDYCKYGEFFTL